jgi:hypothetical protein
MLEMVHENGIDRCIAYGILIVDDIVFQIEHSHLYAIRVHRIPLMKMMKRI